MDGSPAFSPVHIEPDPNKNLSPVMSISHTRAAIASTQEKMTPTEVGAIDSS